MDVLSIPPPGAWTSSELNCRLLHSNAASSASAASYPAINLPIDAGAEAAARAKIAPADEPGLSSTAAPAWHPHKPWLAAADCGRKVLIYDMAQFETGTTAPGAPPPQPRMVLQHELQQQVSAYPTRVRAP